MKIERKVKATMKNATAVTKLTTNQGKKKLSH